MFLQKLPMRSLGFGIPILVLIRLKSITIPDPGSQTSVSFSAPANSNYFAGVVAYINDTQYHSAASALAGGKSNGFIVESGSNTKVTINAVPWKLQITSAPDTLISGTEITIEGKVINGPISDFTKGYMDLCYGVKEFTEACPTSTTRAYDKSGSGNRQFKFTFNAPTVDSKQIFRFQIHFSVDGDTWNSAEPRYVPDVFLPSLILNENVFQIPIVPESDGDGSITISFDKNK